MIGSEPQEIWIWALAGVPRAAVPHSLSGIKTPVLLRTAGRGSADKRIGAKQCRMPRLLAFYLPLGRASPMWPQVLVSQGSELTKGLSIPVPYGHHPMPCSTPACLSASLHGLLLVQLLLLPQIIETRIFVLMGFFFLFHWFFSFSFFLTPLSHYPPLRQPFKCTSCECVACICSCKVCVLSDCI